MIQETMINPGATVIGGLNIFKSEELDNNQVSKAYDTVFSSLHTSMRWMNHDARNVPAGTNMSTMIRLPGNENKYLTTQIKNGQVNLGIYDKETGKVSSSIDFNELGIPPITAIKAIERLEERTRNMCFNLLREKDSPVLIVYSKLDQAWNEYDRNKDLNMDLNKEIENDEHDDLVVNE